MNNKNFIWIIIIIVLAGFGAYRYFNSPQAQIEKAKDVYYCPMHPQIQSDKPGTCPICHMKLVKKEDKHAPKHTQAKESVDGYRAVDIDEHKQKLIGLKTVAVEKRPLIKTIYAYGYVAHDLELYEAQLEYIYAWHDYYAFLARRPVKDDYRIDWREYYKQEPTKNRWRSHDKVEVQRRLVKAEYELRHMGLNDAQLEQLRTIKYGQLWVQPDLLFFEENQPFWIYVQVPEAELGFLAEGQRAIVNIPTYNEKTEGIIKNVTTFIDPQTRTTRVRVEMSKYRGELSVNMLVNVEFPVELDTHLVVAREAVMDLGTRKIVFVETKEGVFEPREITTGFYGDGVVAVKSGLKEGERVVSNGNFLLDSESRLQSVWSGGHSHD